MARQAFELLLDLRTRDDAPHLLSQAIAFLEMLARKKDLNAAPMMISVRAVQLRKP
jgi:hypothetical protein